MKKKKFFVPGIFLLLFLLFTSMAMKVDVQPIGPNQSEVGFATLNQFVFEKIGVNLVWYSITDWLGIVAIIVALGFGGLGFLQLFRRKSLLKVDSDIILLGVYYFLVILFYIVFEVFIVNYRPILINEVLEGSYPSSHTMVVICIMATAMVQFKKRIINPSFRKVGQILSIAVITVTVIGRLISGVHWFTDILAGIFLGTSLALFYILRIEA